MRIALFGATGGTGRAVIDRALQAGHQVKALARRADKLLPRDGLTVVQGDAMVAEDVARTMADSDAVVVALGNSQNAFALLFGARRTTPRDICEAGTRNILAALGDGGIGRSSLSALLAWVPRGTNCPACSSCFIALFCASRSQTRNGKRRC